MDSDQNCSWFVEYMDDVQAAEYLWPPQVISDQAVSGLGLGLEVLLKDENCAEKSCLKKRGRIESSAGPGTKACREKMRRDRLNDRFLELCSILEPGRLPKADKVVILNDATRLLNQLHLEAQKLKETNDVLKVTIQNLKTEKVELRDEKVKLKAEKERMEQMVKGLCVPCPFVPHHTFPAATTTYSVNGKNIPYQPSYLSPMAMWQWMPSASWDTTQDHVLRPPVA
ncbi:PREDICTED: transcription factor ILR3-like [Nelumbo nucifera]|uniref:Transcription factor ILR3-like n=2 Tax=Nelumbo nucifera TaxID=4432 RepID=A0A1U8A5X5_NELNU|nr:PREDICTED: transcription factor ILR3-like [Nelumbo nucifera]DAD26545.1 TPA_asm: hypothetical protein HUJ06_028013 [Nelumbo nucifera]